MTITLPSGNSQVWGSETFQCLCQCSIEAVQLHIIDLRKEHTTAMHQLQMDASSLNVALAQHMIKAKADNGEQHQQLRCAVHGCHKA